MEGDMRIQTATLAALLAALAWLCPCPMRDHFSTLRRTAIETGARPINEAAADALNNPEYQQVMEAYADRYKELSTPVWDEQFADIPVMKK